ncbi:ribonuclease toxin immunity protein CdiI [Pectobacterium aroidearum]|nr:ribonuclease toxin immunity protein CdiI [Pectobacterium aroidearum]
MYEENRFLEAVKLLSRKWTLNIDGAYCNFPDMNSYDESEHFEGVEFAIGYPPTEEETIIVSEEICYQYVHLACERYVKFHPENAEKVNFFWKKYPNNGIPLEDKSNFLYFQCRALLPPNKNISLIKIIVNTLK